MMTQIGGLMPVEGYWQIEHVRFVCGGQHHVGYGLSLRIVTEKTTLNYSFESNEIHKAIAQLRAEMKQQEAKK